MWCSYLLNGYNILLSIITIKNMSIIVELDVMSIEKRIVKMLTLVTEYSF